MPVLSCAPNDREIAIDADLGCLCGFILEQFPAKNKAIEEGMRKTENRAGGLRCRGSVTLYVDNRSLSIIEMTCRDDPISRKTARPNQGSHCSFRL